VVLTETEKNDLRQALIDLHLGKRVVATEHNGVRREFQRADIPALEKLLADADIADGTVALRTYARNAGVSS
jgi:hypothetical protein